MGVSAWGAGNKNVKEKKNSRPPGGIGKRSLKPPGM